MKIVTKKQLIETTPARFRKYHEEQAAMALHAASTEEAAIETAEEAATETVEETATETTDTYVIETGLWIDTSPTRSVPGQIPPHIQKQISELESLGDKLTEKNIIRITGEKRWTELNATRLVAIANVLWSSRTEPNYLTRLSPMPLLCFELFQLIGPILRHQVLPLLEDGTDTHNEVKDWLETWESLEREGPRIDLSQSVRQQACTELYSPEVQQHIQALQQIGINGGNLVGKDLLIKHYALLLTQISSRMSATERDRARDELQWSAKVEQLTKRVHELESELEDWKAGERHD